MKKFVFLYKGNGSAPAGSQEETMKAWMDWFTELGAIVVDGGNPFNDGGQAVTKNGVSEINQSSAVTGYTIVNAQDMAAAVEIAKGCPVHLQEGGVASVEVFEALPM